MVRGTSIVRLRNCNAGFALTPTLSQRARELFYPLALWERVAEGRVRDAGVALLYGNRAMQKSNRTTLD